MSATNQNQNDWNWMGKARSRLAGHRTEKPATKAGQVRALWPDIEAAIAVGQSMKTICKWLAEDAGIAISVTTLTSYASRIRRREKRRRLSEVPITHPFSPEFGSPSRDARPPVVGETLAAHPPEDPLARTMRVLSQPKMDIRKLHNDGDPEGRNLI